jgi:hypothetical protein
MKSVRLYSVESRAKASSGLIGFGEVTGGGLPRGRPDLLAGRPACGKTIVAPQFLVALLPDPSAKRREIYRPAESLLARELTGLISVKAARDEGISFGQQPFGLTLRLGTLAV